MTKISVLLAASALLFTVPAHAASEPSGLRIEGVAALDILRTRFGTDPNKFNPLNDRDTDLAYGADIGYDFVRGDRVSVGVDAEYTRSTANRDVIVNGSRVGEVKFNDDFYGGARVTYALSKRFDVVGKFGITSLGSRFNKDPKVTLTSPSPFGKRIQGVRGAVGVHYHGSEEDRTYYGLEYRYSDYESNITRHQGALVVGVRF